MISLWGNLFQACSSRRMYAPVLVVYRYCLLAGTPQLLSHDHPAVLDRLQDQSSDDSSQKSFLESLKDGYLWGVPKKRKSFEKRKMKQFGSSYRLPYKPRTDLITCLHCGNSHEAHTICGKDIIPCFQNDCRSGIS